MSTEILRKDFSNHGITQKIFSDLLSVSPSTINKVVAERELKPLDSNASRNIRYSISDMRAIADKFKENSGNSDCKVMAFYNFKGGVGKTSICFEVSTHLALMGYNVLVVDADPQAHLSTALSFDTSLEYPTLFDVVMRDLIPETSMVEIFPGLDCLPSNLSLTRLESDLDTLPRREERVSIALSKLKSKYDFIIFDCNPTISRLNMNIVSFSDILPIVVETQLFSINGLKMLLQDLEKFCDRMIIDMPEVVVIPNKYEDRTASAGEAVSVLKKHYGKYVMPDFAIRMSEELKTSTKLNLPLALFCRSNSIAFEDIVEVIKYLLKVCFKQKEGTSNLKQA